MVYDFLCKPRNIKSEIRRAEAERENLRLRMYPSAVRYDTDKVQAGKIAPGTEGSCTITISNEHSDVGVDYTIKLSADDNQPQY